MSSLLFRNIYRGASGSILYNLKMSIFTQSLNSITGQNEWLMQPSDYDYKQEVARSSYGDMLHDKERNELYYEGIQRSITVLKEKNKEVHVLDIGTGTGLLSMMALSCGVDSVTACEAFAPMAECAAKIFKFNGFSEKVNLIGKRSTELTVGPGCDMTHRANLLVAEVFDTELIGEGAIETFSHARENLLTPDALIVPSEGTVYAQVVSSSLISRWNKVMPIHNKQNRKTLLRIPPLIQNCPGAAAVHDLQMSEISSEDFVAITEPLDVFHFDWSGRRKSLQKLDCARRSVRCLASGRCDAVLMWWRIAMDPLGEVELSCAPLTQHPFTAGRSNVNSSELPWRDHWIQAIYYPPQNLEVEKSEELQLTASHDEYSLWFDVDKKLNSVSPSRPACECGLHATSSRTRIGQLSDPRRIDLFQSVLRDHVTSETVALFVGDSCLQAIVAAKLGARHVYLEPKGGMTASVLKEFISSNDVNHLVTILPSSLEDTSVEDLVAPISLVFAEPYFDTAILPWHALRLVYRAHAAKHLLAEGAMLLPKQMSLRAMPVQLRDLWKIRAPLRQVCGFSVEAFDELIGKASEEADDIVEAQPLWEYPAVALAAPRTLLFVDLSLETQSLQSTRQGHEKLPIEVQGNLLNGVAMWADWHFDEDKILSTGPVENILPGKQVSWDMYSQQGVRIFPEPFSLEDSSPPLDLKVETTFDASKAKVTFQFDVNGHKQNGS